MTVLIVPNTGKPAAIEAACRAAEVLHGEGVSLLMAGETTAQPFHSAVHPLPEAEAYAACDMVITVGGDGTLLHAAHLAVQGKKPLLGINSGRLGFLTALESNEIHRLACLPKGEYRVEHRSMLQAVFGGAKPCTALNDIVLYKESGSKTIGLDIFCDDVPVSGFRGDGVIFATPTGSTAYSLSAGGPVVDAAMGAIVATQICAHIVQSPPMVFGPGRVLRAVPRPDIESAILLSCDGCEPCTLPPGTEVVISQAPTTVLLVQFGGAGQLEMIDKKLKWR